MIITQEQHVSNETKEIKGELITFENETYYKIALPEVKPFLEFIKMEAHTFGNHFLYDK